MITIVYPFYRKDVEFNYVFQNYNLHVLNNIVGLRLIIVIDDPTHYESSISMLNDLVAKSLIKFHVKVIINDYRHDWRPPCKAINVGIRHANTEKILVLSPETIILKNSIDKLERACNEHSFSLGLVQFIKLDITCDVSLDDIISKYKSKKYIPYGSIMFTKKQAELINGYNENYSQWGGDDDDFRNRLKMAGFDKKITLATFLHVNIGRSCVNSSQDKKAALERTNMKNKIINISTSKKIIVNSNQYGLDFNRVIFEFNPEEILAAADE